MLRILLTLCVILSSVLPSHAKITNHITYRITENLWIFKDCSHQWWSYNLDQRNQQWNLINAPPKTLLNHFIETQIIEMSEDNDGHYKPQKDKHHEHS